MGTDIHLAVQQEIPLTYNRSDRYIQQLRREGCDLWPYVLESKWELIAVEQEWHDWPVTKKWSSWVSAKVVIPDWWCGRNYELFSELAGVRLRNLPIAPARGYPPDWDGPMLGYHDESYLNFEELRGVTTSETFSMFVEAWCEQYAPRRIRLVFGFDS